jgi:hypothetical protein
MLNSITIIKDSILIIPFEYSFETKNKYIVNANEAIKLELLIAKSIEFTPSFLIVACFQLK